MAQRNDEKDRKCEHCSCTLRMTAAQIKAHAKACEAHKKEGK